MATPLFDAHGLTINDPSDGYHTNSEVQGFINSIGSVPVGERVAYHQAVVVHWNHIHFGGGGDLNILRLGRDGTFSVETSPTDYTGLDNRDGLEFPPV